MLNKRLKSCTAITHIVWLGWAGLCCAVLCWAGLGRAGLGWARLGYAPSRYNVSIPTTWSDQQQQICSMLLSAAGFKTANIGVKAVVCRIHWAAGLGLEAATVTFKRTLCALHHIQAVVLFEAFAFSLPLS